MEQAKLCWKEEQCVELFCVHVYAGWWEALNNVAFLDKLYFGSSVCKMKQLCSVVLISEEMAGWEKYTMKLVWEWCEFHLLCKSAVICQALPQKKGKWHLFKSSSDTSPRKVYLIYASFFPTDRCVEVRGELSV